MGDAEKILEAYHRFFDKLPEWMHLFFSTGTTLTEVIVKNSLQALFFAFLGWALASYLEHRHNKQLTEREKDLTGIHVTTAKRTEKGAESGVIIYSSVVVAHDIFRTLIIQIRKIIGGNIKAYERLMLRGRREAFIRLKEDAQLRGFNKVINVRFAASSVTGRFLHAVEVVAYGTGVHSDATTSR